MEVWSRQSDDSVVDSEGACARSGEEAACGTYFVVTDYLGKPVLMLDAQRQVTGVADYDPFGHVNRVSYLGQARAASEASSLWTTFGYFTQPLLAKDAAGAPLEEVQLRARFANVDTDDASTDFAYLTEKSGTAASPGLTLASSGAASNVSVGGPGVGPTQTAWVKMPASGQVHVRFRSDGAADSSRLGVTLEGYEYRRFQAGAGWVWTPLRFPGQYHDAETDLFENWNRYYDPSIGRYLGPEPMMADPSWVAKQVGSGGAPAIYAYAQSSPIAFADPTGLETGIFVDGLPSGGRWGFFSGIGEGVASAASDGTLAMAYMNAASASKLTALVPGGFSGVLSSKPVMLVLAELTAAFNPSGSVTETIQILLSDPRTASLTRALLTRGSINVQALGWSSNNGGIAVGGSIMVYRFGSATVPMTSAGPEPSMFTTFMSRLAHEIGHEVVPGQASANYALLFESVLQERFGLSVRDFHPRGTK